MTEPLPADEGLQRLQCYDPGSAATFPGKSQAAHSSAFNKAFNATDSAACCFSALCWRCEETVTVAEQTKKRSMTTDDETSKTNPKKKK